MEILYQPKKTKLEVFSYTINKGGELNIRVSNGSDRTVSISFEDEKFKGVEHNLGEFNERSNWHVFGAIAKKIDDIESNYMNKEAG